MSVPHIERNSSLSEDIIDKAPCSINAIILIAVGLIIFLGSALATWLVYGYLENWSFMILGVGASVGITLIVVGVLNQDASTASTASDPQPETSISTFNLPSEKRKAFAKGKLQSRTALVSYSLIKSVPEFKTHQTEVVRKLADPPSLTLLEDRGIGIMLGMAVGDAFGAPYEFLAYQDTPHTQDNNRFKLEKGQWTDDTSMGLCLADSLIEANALDEAQLMVSFSDWWNHGYNNAFTGHKPKGSVGLGGNISSSMEGFKGGRNASGSFATSAGDKNTSGNGSLMRLGPIALFAKSLEEARALARRQSLVTHQGEEAAACCELMVTILFTALHHPSRNPKEVKAAAFASLNTFACAVTSVNELAQSLATPTQAGENWNWKDPQFKFHPERLKLQPGYIGSYAMDGLAMALHWIWKTDLFEDVIRGTGSRGGDADTVAAIAGQMAGAIYGYNNIPLEWIQDVQTWDRGGEIATRAHLLLTRQPH